VLFDLICAESNCRVDDVESATEGLLDPLLLNIGVGALVQMGILELKRSEGFGSVQFSRQPLANAWKRISSQNHSKIDSALIIAKDAQKAKTEPQATTISQKIERLNLEAAQKRNQLLDLDVAEKQNEVAQKKKLLDLEVSHQLKQYETQDVQQSIAKTLAEVELAKAKKMLEAELSHGKPDL
jgi:hypothetical protein